MFTENCEPETDLEISLPDDPYFTFNMSFPTKSALMQYDGSFETPDTHDNTVNEFHDIEVTEEEQFKDEFPINKVPSPPMKLSKHASLELESEREIADEQYRVRLIYLITELFTTNRLNTEGYSSEYLESDVCELHLDDRWKKDLEEIKNDELWRLKFLIAFLMDNGGNTTVIDKILTLQEKAESFKEENC
jgi:hypothetical protein